MEKFQGLGWGDEKGFSIKNMYTEETDGCFGWIHACRQRAFGLRTNQKAGRTCPAFEKNMWGYFNVMMTRRYGSSPSEWVVTLGSDCNAECRILRS